MTEFEIKALELLQSIAENIESIKKTATAWKDKEARKIDAMNKTMAGFREKNKK